MDIEKIAEAIRTSYCGKGSIGTWKKMSKQSKNVWILQAKAAVKEIERQNEKSIYTNTTTT